MITKQQIFDLASAHPDWTARQIATVLGCKPQQIHKYTHSHGLKFAKAVGHWDNIEIIPLGRAARRAGLTIAMIEQMGDNSNAN